jgi:hypothetical protein
MKRAKPIFHLQVKNKPHDEMQFVRLFLNRVGLQTEQLLEDIR